MKKAIFRLLVLAILAGGGWYGYQWYKKSSARQEQVATGKVQRGDVVIRAYTRGEVHSVRSVELDSPNLNGTVQVTTLAPAGAMAHEKDLVVEYDDSERQAALDEAQMAVDSDDEQIKYVKANQAITKSQDDVSLLTTRYNIRRAELNVQKNPVIDVIDGKKNLLSVVQDNEQLTQLETDVAMRQAQFASQLAVYQQNRQRDLLNVSREVQHIANCKTLAPISGIVQIQQNRSGNFNFGMVMPDIREGDTLTPGMAVANILDLSEVEIWAKVGELDRANLKEGQDAVFRLDSVSDKQFHGKIKQLSGTASADVFSGDPSKKFDVVFSVDMRQLLSELGMKPSEVDSIMATAEANSKKNGLFGALAGTPGATPAMFGQGGQGGDQGTSGRGAGRGTGRGQGGGDAAAGGTGRGQGGGDAAAGGTGRGQGGGDAAAGGTGRGQGGGDTAAGGTGRGQGGGDTAASGTGRGQGGGDTAASGTGRRQGGGDTAAGGTGRGQGGGDAAAGGRGQGGGTGGNQASGGQGGGRGGDQGGGEQLTGMAAVQAMMRRSDSQFTEEERNNAKLPLPPEKDSQVQTLLRPGLLADAEVVVETLPNVLHVPAQAVFQSNGKRIVYVRQADGKFMPREVQISRESESLVVLSSGVEAGEVIALADPTGGKGSNTKTEKKSDTNPMSSMPGAK